MPGFAVFHSLGCRGLSNRSLPIQDLPHDICKTAARRLGIPKRRRSIWNAYVSLRLRLTLLVPDIIEAVLTLLWTEQREKFGFPARP